MKYLVQFLRFLVGAFFIFSGYVKLIDPKGFGIKMSEYFDVFGMPWLKSLAVPLSALMSGLEIVLGVMLILGTSINLTMWLLILLMLFFTFLTGYTAITGKVTDCGCFGDFLKLKPIVSFRKDLLLMVLLAILFVGRRRIKPLFNGNVSKGIIGLAIAFCVIMTYWCIEHLPVHDFRAYAIGKHLPTMMTLAPDAKPSIVETVWIYKDKTTGEEANYSTADAPWSDQNLEFVDRKDEMIQEGDVPKIQDFRVEDNDGNDITNDILTNPNYSLWVISYNVKKGTKKGFVKTIELSEKAAANNIDFIALTSSLYEEREAFRHDVGLSYPIHSCDEKVLKTIVRANPGMVLMKDGVVIDKWHYNDIPTFEELEKKYLR